jgi:uncharacterized 2Fe-2S/4Fe-4S cluster protein (DUF4445 family)
MSIEKHRVIFQPMGVRAELEDGMSLRTAARAAGVAIDSICGERATCGKCKVIIREGEFPKEGMTSQRAHLSPPGSAEAAYLEKRRKGLAAGGEDPEAFRLSCQARVCGDVVVVVPPGSQAVRQVVRKAARERRIDIFPLFRKIYIELEPSTLADPGADWERVRSQLLAADPVTRGPRDLPLDSDGLIIALPALRALPWILRKGDWRLTATIRAGREVVRVEPGYAGDLLGLAVDIGTTTLAAHLSDLQTGELLATADAMNPQIGFGEDIMARMSFANETPGGAEKLQAAILDSLNKLARKVSRQAGRKATEIVDVVIVGNTVMHHFFLGIETESLGRAPYVPALRSSLDIRARAAGLKAVNEGAYLHLPPVVASFIGPDHMGVLLAEAPHEQDETWLIVDVGTNAELVLGNRQRLVCTSTPTGPAFEGAHIEYGMRAAQGAIEQVHIDPKTLIPRVKVIGSDLWSDEPGAPPARGICGTGIIDAVAELYRVGLLKSDGGFDLEKESPNLFVDEDSVSYILTEASRQTIGRDIPITQEDIRQVQLAKAPLYVAAQYLLREFGLERPDRILLAGGFGTHIDPEKAMLLGMIPDCPLDRVHAVGNAAGDGARLALLSRVKRADAEALLARIERIELPAQPGFQDQFTLALHIPHMVDLYPSLEGLAPPRGIDPMVARLFGDSVPGIDDVSRI